MGGSYRIYKLDMDEHMFKQHLAKVMVEKLICEYPDMGRKTLQKML